MLPSCHSSINLPLPLNAARRLCLPQGTVTHRGDGTSKGVTVKKIPLSNSKRFALVDDSDFVWLSHFRWNEFKSTSAKLGMSYAYTSLSTHCIFMHKMILQGARQIDHRDCNGLNNQRCNLRPYVGAQNQHNSRKRKNTSSKYKGVCWHKPTKRWRSLIVCDHKRYHLGTFCDEKLAGQAYDAAAIRLFGEFARLNFPKEAYARGEKGEK